MLNNINILEIDEKIKSELDDKMKKKNDYLEILNQLKLSKKNVKNTFKVGSPLANENILKIDKEIKNICTDINNLDTKQIKDFYIAETIEILLKYKQILNTPQVVSFMGVCKSNNNEKNKLIKEYLKIAKKYIKLDAFIKNNEKNTKKKKYKCKNCSNKEFDIVNENLKICIQCGAEEKFTNYTTSYKDVSRVNISTKYTYDRKIHFRDCINQYQGKQNCTIDPKIYEDIIDQLDKHHLLIKSKKKKKRFSKVKKSHILLFLKELGYCKHYENLNLIFFNITQKPIDDITYLETKLLEDFDKLTQLYDKMFKNKIDRKNMINTSFILFMLLRRHGHPCKQEDFSVLKTIDRKNFHNEICKKLFEALNWGFNPN